MLLSFVTIFQVVRWGLVRDYTLLPWKWLHVILNDDFFEKGECYDLALLPSIICLGRFCIACILSLTAVASGCWLFGSVVRALDFYPGKPGSNPTVGGKFFQLCFFPLLRISSCKNIFFLFFSWKTGFDISCKLSPMETIWMKCQILFSSKK